MNQKNNNVQAAMPKYTSKPGKMRADILRVFNEIPDDTRDIIAQFWILTLKEQLPTWQRQGNAARAAKKGPGATEADPGRLAPST